MDREAWLRPQGPKELSSTEATEQTHSKTTFVNHLYIFFIRN